MNRNTLILLAVYTLVAGFGVIFKSYALTTFFVLWIFVCGIDQIVDAIKEKK